jgi:hypothetical protein
VTVTFRPGNEAVLTARFRNWTSLQGLPRLDSYHCSFLTARFHVKISDWRPALLTQIVRGFFHILEADISIVAQKRKRELLVHFKLLLSFTSSSWWILYKNAFEKASLNTPRVNVAYSLGIFVKYNVSGPLNVFISYSKCYVRGFLPR